MRLLLCDMAEPMVKVTDCAGSLPRLTAQLYYGSGCKTLDKSLIFEYLNFLAYKMRMIIVLFYNYCDK